MVSYTRSKSEDNFSLSFPAVSTADASEPPPYVNHEHSSVSTTTQVATSALTHYPPVLTSRPIESNVKLGERVLTLKESLQKSAKELTHSETGAVKYAQAKTEVLTLIKKDFDKESWLYDANHLPSNLRIAILNRLARRLHTNGYKTEILFKQILLPALTKSRTDPIVSLRIKTDEESEAVESEPKVFIKDNEETSEGWEEISLNEHIVEKQVVERSKAIVKSWLTHFPLLNEEHSESTTLEKELSFMAIQPDDSSIFGFDFSMPLAKQMNETSARFIAANEFYRDGCKKMLSHIYNEMIDSRFNGNWHFTFGNLYGTHQLIFIVSEVSHILSAKGFKVGIQVHMSDKEGAIPKCLHVSLQQNPRMINTASSTYESFLNFNNTYFLETSRSKVKTLCINLEETLKRNLFVRYPPVVPFIDNHVLAYFRKKGCTISNTDLGSWVITI